jgi:type II secretory pathway component PulC
MSIFVRRYLHLLNLVLIAVSVVFAYQTVRAFTTPRVPRERPTLAAAAAQTPATGAASKPDTDRRPLYEVIATRNLFSASRTETPPAVAGVASSLPKVVLHGVVMLDEGRSRAFLEEGNSKKVNSYGIGDQVAGGRIETISLDRVVIARPEGRVEIVLHGPSALQTTTPVGASPAGGSQGTAPAGSAATGGAAPPAGVRR